jgi:hypothetical protein
MGKRSIEAYILAWFVAIVAGYRQLYDRDGRGKKCCAVAKSRKS